MLCKLHAAFTGLLLVGVLSFAALAYTGRVQFGTPSPAAKTEGDGKKEDRSDDTGGRYRIEKVDDVRTVLDGAGKLGFFGLNLLETWVFKYTGGYVQVHVETDVDGKAEAGEVMPSEWSSLLGQDDGLKEDKAASYRKQGYIVLAATPATVSVTEAMANYHFQISGIFAGGNHGPLHVLPPMFLEISHKRPYRLFLNAGPLTGSAGAGFNLWAEHLLPIRSPFVVRSLAEEEFHVGGGKDLQAGKDITLLDRRRGNSRVRLKARFLGDGEVREMATKTN